MKTKDLLHLVALATVLSLTACSGRNDSTTARETSTDSVGTQTLRLVRLDSVIAAFPTMDDAAREASINAYKRELTALRDVIGDKRSLAEWTADFAIGPVAGMFGPAVAEAFPVSVDVLSPEGVARLEDIGVTIPEAVGVTLPYSQSIVFMDDSIALVSLNHWLGSEHPAYHGFPSYVSRLKTPARLPIDFTESLIGRSNPYSPGPDKDNVLTRMLYEGALMAAVMDVTGVDEAAIMGWSPQEYDTALKGERQAWERLITQKMLYSSDPQLQERLTALSPATSIISPDLPGRMGRWIGLRIVESLRRNEPQLTVAEMLSPEFYSGDNVLARSRYAP